MSAWEKSSRHPIPDFPNLLPEPKALFNHINSSCLTHYSHTREGKRFHSRIARLLHWLCLELFTLCRFPACCCWKLGLLGILSLHIHMTAQYLDISEGQLNSPKATFQNLPCPSFHLDFGKRNGIELSVFLSELFWTAQQAVLTSQYPKWCPKSH